MTGPARRPIALLADVHGNLAALRAVLADAAAAGAEALVVAGDHVNRGPDSAAVVDLLRERGARLLRGNHEADYVAVYGTPAMPPSWATAARFAAFRRVLADLGPARRALLAGLPDTLRLDAATVVAHGSPRRLRDEVRAGTPAAELAAMVPDDVTRLVVVAHTHQPAVRDLPAGGGRPACRFVNLGAVGNPLDGDPRASYALAAPAASGEPGVWRVELRRVPYDVEATVAAYDRSGQRTADPIHTELAIRELRTGRPYLGPAIRATAGLPDEDVPAAVRRFLDATP